MHHEAEDIRNMVSSSISYTKRLPAKPAGQPSMNFFSKVRLAWEIFFPSAQAPKAVATSKEEVKKRLRMVLVADRCGMSPANLSEMKKTIVTALQDFVDIEAEDAIEVSISTDPNLGTVYSVNVPVRRVKPETRFGSLPDGEVADGVTLEWNPDDFNSDPSARFPMGC